MDNRKKVIIVVLIVLTLILGVGSIVISQLLQNNQAPSNSNASGFGTAVDRQYFDDFYQAFLTRGCFALLSDSTVNAYAPSGFTEVTKYKYTITNEAPEDKNPLNCTIKLNDGSKEIDLSVYTYDQNSGIDPTADALFSRVNANISSISETLNATNMHYYFGTDAQDSTSCRLNLFNSKNDFEYITLVYKNFNKSCTDLKTTNDEFAFVLSTSVKELINSITNPVSYTQ